MVVVTRQQDQVTVYSESPRRLLEPNHFWVVRLFIMLLATARKWKWKARHVCGTSNKLFTIEPANPTNERSWWCHSYFFLLLLSSSSYKTHSFVFICCVWLICKPKAKIVAKYIALKSLLYLLLLQFESKTNFIYGQKSCSHIHTESICQPTNRRQRLFEQMNAIGRNSFMICLLSHRFIYFDRDLLTSAIHS